MSLSSPKASQVAPESPFGITKVNSAKDKKFLKKLTLVPESKTYIAYRLNCCVIGPSAGEVVPLLHSFWERKQEEGAFDMEMEGACKEEDTGERSRRRRNIKCFFEWMDLRHRSKKQEIKGKTYFVSSSVLLSQEWSGQALALMSLSWVSAFMDDLPDFTTVETAKSSAAVFVLDGAGQSSLAEQLSALTLKAAEVNAIPRDKQPVKLLLLLSANQDELEDAEVSSKIREWRYKQKIPSTRILRATRKSPEDLYKAFEVVARGLCDNFSLAGSSNFDAEKDLKRGSIELMQNLGKKGCWGRIKSFLLRRK